MSASTRISVEQYDAMILRGEFEPREEHHVELVYGEIVAMSPIGAPHDDVVDELGEWSFEALPPHAVRVKVRGPIAIPALDSEPEPDLVSARRKNYRSRHARPEDVLLLIEVSDSSLAKDRGLKARLYAEAGIADYWIVNLVERCVEVRRGPTGSTYGSIQVFQPGQEVRPLAFPEVALVVSRLFPS